MEDPRRTNGGHILHKLEDIIIIGLCTVVCGGEDFPDMEEFGKEREEWLRKFLELGGISFSEMNKRLPEVATAIKQHDTTGMAETFEQISKRLKELLISVGSVYPDGSNILVVTHAFLMKTAAYLFDFENIGNLSNIGNADRMKLLFDGQNFRIR